MLYDNALLMLAYCKALRHHGTDALPPGGHGDRRLSLQRDVPGLRRLCQRPGCRQRRQRGAYYALRPEEVLAVLGEDQGTAFNACYDITEEGNFHGFSIPNLLHSPLPGDRFAACIPALYAYRLGPGPAFIGTIKCWPGGTAC